MATKPLELQAEVSGDGAIALRWSCATRAGSFHVLIIRTGAVRAYTAIQLAGEVTRYGITGLSRHQRYLVAVLPSGAPGVGLSEWLSVTPRSGLQPRPEPGSGLEAHLGRVQRFTVMPQNRRLTAYWQVGSGFVDQLALELVHRGRVVKTLTLEPEVTSVSLDASRGIKLTNGETYAVRLQTLFAGRVQHCSPDVRCTPAPQGEERQANSSFPQSGLVYPCLALTPEVQIFDDEPLSGAAAASPGADLVCFRCGRPVRWQDYRLICTGCQAEFLPNGRGDYLALGELRFGACRCCLPRKILVQKTGTDSLVCAHSGKEHIRAADGSGYLLIEDLPHGLCQCCRPRRPLVRRGSSVVCSKSGEKHQQEQGRYVLVPSQLVFDAAAIDDLLDAGLAEICSAGVSRARR